MADDPSAPVDTPGRVWIYLMTSASPVAETIDRNSGKAMIRVPASRSTIRSDTIRDERIVSRISPTFCALTENTAMYRRSITGIKRLPIIQLLFASI